MSFEHPYPDYAYLDVDHETNEKRWFGTKGMGVGYVHEDRVAEMVEAAVAAEREACAKVAADWGQRQSVTTADVHIPGADHGEQYASTGIADAIRARSNPSK